MKQIEWTTLHKAWPACSINGDCNYFDSYTITICLTHKIFHLLCPVVRTLLFFLNVASIFLITSTDERAEVIKKRWKEYAEELYKKDLNELDFYDFVVSHPEPDILEFT